MSRFNPLRWRAERFAQLLDQADSGGRHHVRGRLDNALAPLVALGHQISEKPSPATGIDPDFRCDLRAMLVATAQREGIGADAVADTAPGAGPEANRGIQRARVRAATGPGRAARRARARAAIIISVAAGAITVSGMSAASDHALPGDALYGVKRSTERAQVSLAGSDLTRGQLFLSFAQVRMDEARILRQDAVAFSAVLDDMDHQTRQGVRLLTAAAVQGGDRNALDAIDDFVAAQRPAVRRFTDDLALAPRDRALTSLALLDTIRQRSAALRDGLLCTNPAVVDRDTLGPLPATCAAESPRGGEAGTRLPGRPADDVARPDTGPASAPTAVAPVKESPAGRLG